VGPPLSYADRCPRSPCIAPLGAGVSDRRKEVPDAPYRTLAAHRGHAEASEGSDLHRARIDGLRRPAPGGGTGGSSDGWGVSFSVCDPLGTSSLLSSSPAATGAVAGRGAPVREPDLGQPHDDLPASAKGQAEAGFSTTVPVYVHVVTDGQIGAVTNSDISAQLRVLNQTFAAAEGGATTGFSFQLAGVTRTDTRTGSTPALAESTRTR
jgi:hypothetical protein